MRKADAGCLDAASLNGLNGVLSGYAAGSHGKGRGRAFAAKVVRRIIEAADILSNNIKVRDDVALRIFGFELRRHRNAAQRQEEAAHAFEGVVGTFIQVERPQMFGLAAEFFINAGFGEFVDALHARLKILWRHALRNAIMPVVTVMGPTVASVLTGTFVIESIFNIPGLGKYFVTSIKDLDYTMIGGTVVFYGGLLIVCTLVVDLLYGFIDPRVKLEG